MDPQSRAAKKITSQGNEVLPQNICVSYKDNVTNEDVHAKVQQATGPHEDLMTMVKRRKRKWCGHVFRSSGLAKRILQSTGRRQGRQKKRVGKQHQGTDRPGVRQVSEGSGKQRKMEETSCKVICGAQTTLVVKG